MRTGSLFNERFEIDRRAGSGGMSVVYRARDVTSGEICALKLLTGEGARQLERFDREGRVLAELRHPAIVRYVDHGVTTAGERYLAMEWLEGEDLAERLARAPLTIGEALVLARVVAEALGVAHARGVVHRDVKPSNLFLPDGRIDRVKILDFGIARLADDGAQPTRTGVRVGTPAYMSPEQARGLSTIDARTDVFSLGCVLYQCLTGVKPFSGDDVLAVLAKILLEEPQPVDRLRVEAPAALSELIGRMLAKAPDARPRDGATVAAEAARVAQEVSPVRGRRRAATTTGPPPALTVRERRVVSVVAAHDPDAAARADELRAAIERAAPGGGLRVEALKNGTIVVAVTGPDVATDLAARAARVALAMRAASRGPVALATGRADVSAELPVGEVIERVSRMLRAASVNDSDETLDLHAAPRPGTPTAILLDETTAGLLDARFTVSGDERGLALVGERAAVDATRTLLGRPTPCVGREPELAALEAAYAACEGGEARAVLITAPPGVGKSRVRYELLRRLAARETSPEVWVARGDPLSAGAAFGLLGAALRRAAGILDGEAEGVRQRKLRARVARHVAPADQARVAEFLGELTGTPFPDDESVQLRAARRDAQLMGDQLRRAWEDFLAAECNARPVVIVVEDLQWGDATTVSYLDAALRRLREAPLLVVALARPDVHELFPRLWVDRGVQQIRLGDLPRKAAERLAREVLGPRADAAAIAKIVERAGGNAFYLEELLRAVADGRDDLPETVLTMVQARLESMEGEARRILRAASVFGEAFWTGGVATLLGGASQAAQVGEWLRELAAREVVSPRPSSRFPGEQEHVFRHAIVREAAYAMLTDADRALGHRLAGAWLTRLGEPSATALAEHFERGGEPSAAVDWWRRSAEQALGANDLPAALAACARGVACGAAGETLGALRLCQAEAHIWRAEYNDGADAAEQAMRWLPRGGDAWYAALDQAASALFSLGERERLIACARELGEIDLLGGAAGRGGVAAVDQRSEGALRTAARMIPSLIYAGAPAEAARLWAALDALAAHVGERDPALAGAILMARGAQALFEGDSAGMLDCNRAAIPLLERAGDLRRVERCRGTVGYCALELGAFDDAIAALRETIETSSRLGLPSIASTARQNLGMALCYGGAIDLARTEQSKSVQEFVEAGNRRMEVASRYYLGYIRMVAGDLAGAEKSARAAVEMALGPPLLPPVRAEGLGILAAILLAQGRAAEALDAAREAMRLLEELGGIDGGEPMIRLAHAEALHATGDVTGAAVAIGAALDRLRARAAKIRDPRLRASFLEAVPENARTAALAAAWCRT